MAKVTERVACALSKLIHQWMDLTNAAGRSHRIPLELDADIIGKGRLPFLHERLQAEPLAVAHEVIKSLGGVYSLAAKLPIMRFEVRLLLEEIRTGFACCRYVIDNFDENRLVFYGIGPDQEKLNWGILIRCELDQTFSKYADRLQVLSRKLKVWFPGDSLPIQEPMTKVVEDLGGKMAKCFESLERHLKESQKPVTAAIVTIPRLKATSIDTDNFPVNETTPSNPDGPFGVDSFYIDGIKIRELPIKQMRLLGSLVKAKGKAIDVSDLIGPGNVWDDDYQADDNAVGGMRKRINRIFKDYGVKRHVKTADNYQKICLKEGSPPEKKEADRKKPAKRPRSAR